MRFDIQAVVLSAAVFGLAACSGPLVRPEPPTFQAKAGHVNDWSDLASRTASRFVGAMPEARTVYVVPGPSDMPFASAYRALLEQELLKRGLIVTETASVISEVSSDGRGELVQVPLSPVVLRFEVQTFWYRNDDRKLPVDYATFWTTAFALGAQLRHVTSLDTGTAIAAGAGPVFDVLASLYDTTKAEALLTLTVTDGSRLIYRDPETIYIHPSELSFYWTHMGAFEPQAKLATAREIPLSVRAEQP